MTIHNVYLGDIDGRCGKGGSVVRRQVHQHGGEGFQWHILLVFGLAGASCGASGGIGVYNIRVFQHL